MNPDSLVRHELAGLDVEVVDSPNPDLVGIAGRVVDETMHTLLVAASDGMKRVPKADATFRFDLDDTAVVVEGDRLVARPARRTELKGGSLWQ
ncbi:ribonuclease P protein component 1 [Natronomonas halophila]|uniref:ribonuclease P protein component 1 n=1 Tax=Natronomonas halophila TaxID=2747817 RepID=UPI0015B56390|nr:ribonuclease P protein component 1 [Natronomonas halophila]QLD84722.1 ribonuclease P protein component 1 [Natronomonas halophila]